MSLTSALISKYSNKDASGTGLTPLQFDLVLQHHSITAASLIGVLRIDQGENGSRQLNEVNSSCWCLLQINDINVTEEILITHESSVKLQGTSSSSLVHYTSSIRQQTISLALDSRTW